MGPLHRLLRSPSGKGALKRFQLYGVMVPALAASAYAHAEARPGSLQAAAAVVCGAVIALVLLKVDFARGLSRD